VASEHFSLRSNREGDGSGLGQPIGYAINAPVGRALAPATTREGPTHHPDGDYPENAGCTQRERVITG